MLHRLQQLYTYIACFCFQYFILVLDVCRKCLYLDVAYVSHICLQVFYLDVAYVFTMFSSVFASVSDACFKCFICLHMYTVSAVSGCFKSRPGVAM